MCYSPFKVKYHDNYKKYRGVLIHAYNEGQLLPCGKCYVCRENKIEEWQIRWSEELKTTNPDYNHFITLTYNDENLPMLITPYGEEKSTLHFPDVQKFLKRIRKHQETYCKKNNIFNPKISYHGCGEYGKKYTKRPHYHLLLTNCLLPQEKITQIWGKGIVHFGDNVTDESIKYILKYTLKSSLAQLNDIRKAVTKTEKYIEIEPFKYDVSAYQLSLYPEFNISRYYPKFTFKYDEITKTHFKYYAQGTENEYRICEKSFMSKGIGKNYISEKNIEMHHKNPNFNYLYYDIKNNLYKIKPLPRYFKEAIFNPVARDASGKRILDKNGKVTYKYSPLSPDYENTPRFKKQLIAFQNEQRKISEIAQLHQEQGDNLLIAYLVNKRNKIEKQKLLRRDLENIQIDKNKYRNIAQLI